MQKRNKRPKKAPTGDYAVGYAKPPTSGQIKPGEVRNPRGRKKGSVNFATLVKRVTSKKVAVKQNGKTIKVTTQEAALLRLVEQALGGNPKLLQAFLVLAKDYSSGNEVEHTTPITDAVDQAILADFLARNTPLPQNLEE